MLSLKSTDGITESPGAHRADIQGLRAVAVLVVVAFHAGLPVPGGFVGVDVFFVISGFVITAMLQREWDQNGRIRFGRFYFRRFKRLTPALAFMVIITVAISTLVLSPAGTQQTAALTAIGAMLLAANAVIARTTGGYFDAPAAENPLLNTWSLSVEEQFYLVFPLMLATSWLLARSRRGSANMPRIMVGLVAVVSLGLALFGASGRSFEKGSELIEFYSPLTRAWEFAAGALLALAGSRFSFVSGAVASTLGVIGIIALLASLWLISEDTPFPGVWTLLPVAGTALLILAGRDSASTVSRGLAALPMVRIGDWSYSIYLWHWPLIVFAGVLWPDRPSALLLAALFSFAPAIASYQWLEQPIRMRSRLTKENAALMILVTLSVPVVLGGALWLGARNWFGNDTLAAYMTAIQSRPIGFEDPVCISKVSVNRRDTRSCQWHSDAPGGPVYLIGDSNAMHFSEALRETGLALHRPVTALGSDGCPLVDAHIRLNAGPQFEHRCRANYVALMDWLEKQPPGIVMISSVDRYWHDAAYIVSADGSFDDANSSRNEAVLNAGLATTVRRLQDAGHAIVLIQTIPHFIAEPYRPARGRCSGLDVLRGNCRPPFATMPVEVADALQGASRLGIRGVAAATGASVLDLRGFFCGDGICSTRDILGNDLYMPDGYHLNRLGSQLLTGEFLNFIGSMDVTEPAGRARRRSPPVTGREHGISRFGEIHPVRRIDAEIRGQVTGRFRRSATPTSP